MTLLKKTLRTKPNQVTKLTKKKENSIANFICTLCVFVCVCACLSLSVLKNSIQEPSLYTLFISELAAASFLASLAGICLTLRICRVFVFCALNNNTQLLIVAYFQARPLLLYIRLSSSCICPSYSFPSLATPTAAVKLCIKETQTSPTSLSARPYYMKKAA